MNLQDDLWMADVVIGGAVWVTAVIRRGYYSSCYVLRVDCDGQAAYKTFGSYTSALAFAHKIVFG